MTIVIDWVYFLGIMGGLIGIAWYTNGRFTKIETSMEWMKTILRDLKTDVDNKNNPAFATASPVNLNPTGEKWLQESGLKAYMDANKSQLMAACSDKKNTNPYEVQKQTFKIMDEHSFDSYIENRLKEYAYKKGTSMLVIRRVAGIYLRNLCLADFKMNHEDIDKHDPGNHRSQ